MEQVEPPADAQLRRLLLSLLRAQSIDQIVTIATRHPESLSPGFSQLLSVAAADGSTRRDWPLVAKLQQITQVLAAMQNSLSAASTRELRIIEILWGTPLGRVFMGLGEVRDWSSWAETLASYPTLYSGECLSFMSRARDVVSTADKW